MKVLILGSGAKDHALAWWFSKSKIIDALYIAPGNPGTENIAVNLPDVDPSDALDVVRCCRDLSIDVVFIGTEAPMEAGVVDILKSNGIRTIGTPGHALKLETDRTYAKNFAKQYGISVPLHKKFDTLEELKAELSSQETDRMVTLKPNYMAPSREIINTDDHDVILSYSKKMLERGPVILEQHIHGLHLTIETLVDENGGFLSLPIAHEYVRREVADNFTTTGGMGAVCPIPLSDVQKQRIREEIILPTMNGIKQEKLTYAGVLVFSVVLEKDTDRPFLVDFHVRFNDPATQAIAPLMTCDIGLLTQAMLDGTIQNQSISTSDRYSVCVVAASEGYPTDPVIGKELKNLNGRLFDTFSTSHFFLGAVQRDKDGVIRTNGGRAATVVSVADSFYQANAQAYKALPMVDFEGCWSRPDIGNVFFNQELS